MPFMSNSTTTSGVLQDYADYALRSLQSQDRVPQSLGTNSPLFDRQINSAEDVMSMMDSAFSRQRATQGGKSTDTPYTPASDTYAGRRRDLLQANEGNNPVAYDDATGRSVTSGIAPKGFVTVGNGFNMDQSAGRSYWQEAFAGTPNAPDFDKVRAGQQALTQPEIATLTDSMANRFEKLIDKHFGGVDLREHQRLALLDVAYQRPADLLPIAAAFKSGDAAGAAKLMTTGPAATVAAHRRARDATMFMGTS